MMIDNLEDFNSLVEFPCQMKEKAINALARMVPDTTEPSCRTRRLLANIAFGLQHG